MLNLLKVWHLVKILMQYGVRSPVKKSSGLNQERKYAQIKHRFTSQNSLKQYINKYMGGIYSLEEALLWIMDSYLAREAMV